MFPGQPSCWEGALRARLHRSLELDGSRRLGCQIVDHSGDARNLACDSAGNDSQVLPGNLHCFCSHCITGGNCSNCHYPPVDPVVAFNSSGLAEKRGEGLGLFRGKPVAVLGASPGGFGTVLAQNHWLPVLRTLGTKPWFQGRMLVSRAGGLFDAEGNLTDERTRAALADFVAGFAAAIKAG